MASAFNPMVDVFSLGRTQYSENIIANISLYNPVTATQKIPANIDVALEKPILQHFAKMLSSE
jgi:hypothetical protein